MSKAYQDMKVVYDATGESWLLYVFLYSRNNFSEGHDWEFIASFSDRQFAFEHYEENYLV